MAHQNSEPAQLNGSPEALLDHIDQELSWASEATTSDGWSDQVLAGSIAASAIYIFQSLQSSPDWGQVLTRFLVISYCWDTLFGLYSWLKRSPGGVAAGPASRGFSTRRLAPVRTLGWFMLVRVVVLLLLTWSYGLQHLGLLLAVLISAQLALRLFLAVTVVLFLSGDWYPPVEMLAQDAYTTPTTRMIGTLEVALAVIIAIIAFQMVPMAGNSSTLPAAGLVAIVHLVNLLLTREGVAGHVEPLRSLRREMALGLIDHSQAHARLSDVLLGDPLDAVAAPFMARHRAISAEGAKLLEELNRNAEMHEVATGPVTPEDVKERLALIERMRSLATRQLEANEETEQLFAGRGWRALRLKLDARWRHAHSQFRATYAELTELAAALLAAAQRGEAAIDRRRAAQREVDADPTPEP